VHAGEAALRNPKRVVRRAFVTANALARLQPLFHARRLKPEVMQPGELDELTGEGAVHQGIVLEVEPLEQPALENFLAALANDAPAVVAILDQVTDPHNIGAVLRSAAAFNIGAIIVQARHSAPLTGTMAKASSGAMDYVPVIEAVNLSRAIGVLKEHGFFVCGFDSEAPGPIRQDVLSHRRLGLVFGSEGKGMRRLVRENCDALYKLAAPGPIKSLNISNAAAIIFYAVAQARCSDDGS
jgi:23S rRNA (guanosine2251-2'-O)-methyltransferase